MKKFDVKAEKIILIDAHKLNKSKYSDVQIVKYTPAIKHPEGKYALVVNFIVSKYICADTEEEISRLIHEELEKES